MARKCINCGREYNPLRKDRCSRCYQYLRKHSEEHPRHLLKCECGNCLICKARENARRRYSGLVYTGKAAGRFKESNLTLPDDAVTLSYIAGLIDGEGCITLANKCWRIQVAMTDEPVIRWLGTFGGSVSERKRYGKRKRNWRWLIMRQSEVVEFLMATMPYLRVKRDQAENAIREIALRDEMRFMPRSEYA